MRFKSFIPSLLSISSGLLFVISLESLIYVLGLIAFVPLLYVIYTTDNWKKALMFSILSGLCAGAYMSFWFIEGLEIFSGGNTLLGILGYVIASFILGIYFGGIGTLFYFCKKYIQNLIIAGIIWAVFAGIWDVLYGIAFQSFPILIPHTAYTQFTNLALLQHAEWGGMHMVSFLTLVINFFIVQYFIRRRSGALWLMIAISSLLHISGLGILKLYENSTQPSDRSIKVSTINPQFTAQDVWNASTGPVLMNRLLSACASAYSRQPDLIVWTEGVVPWSYSADDDFIKELNKINNGRPTLHLIGMKTEDNGRLYNSIHALDFKNNIYKRYDKNKLLAFAERPAQIFSKSQILSYASHYSEGQIVSPLTTINDVKISGIICHENIDPKFVSEIISSGKPDLLVVLANNAWARKSKICTNGHFYISVFRAIENRVPILMNSNSGVAGYVSASGEAQIIDDDFIEINLGK